MSVLPVIWRVNNKKSTSQNQKHDMFAAASSLETIDTIVWNTSNVTSMPSMFAVSSVSYVGDGKLEEIIGIGYWDTGNVTDMTYMFYGAGQMTTYDIADWHVSKVQSFNHMFTDNLKLESLDLSKWNVSSVKTMYEYCCTFSVFVKNGVQLQILRK